jgi:hypothetical protein
MSAAYVSWHHKSIFKNKKNLPSLDLDLSGPDPSSSSSDHIAAALVVLSPLGMMSCSRLRTSTPLTLKHCTDR